MIKIPLKGKTGKGKFALIDDDDFDKVNSVKAWYVLDGYAIATINGKLVPMHRLINNTPIGFCTDHINRKPLDNQKKNLRTVNKSQNATNRSKGEKVTSKYFGVSFAKREKLWRADIALNYKRFNLGGFKNERHAAMVYDIFAKEIFGEFARTNFQTI